MQTRIEAVIFDYGGVLAQTRHAEPRAAWERRLDLAPGALTHIVHDAQVWMAAQCGAVTAAAHWQTVGQRLGLSTAECTALQAAFYQGDVVNAELLACLDRLRAMGLQLGLLSNFSTDLRALLSQQDLARRFDHIAISAEIGMMKPAASAYHTMLGMLDLAPQVCVFIDDLPENVQAAQALGLHGIVYRDDASCLTALEQLLTGDISP